MYTHFQQIHYNICLRHSSLSSIYKFQKVFFSAARLNRLYFLVARIQCDFYKLRSPSLCLMFQSVRFCVCRSSTLFETLVRYVFYMYKIEALVNKNADMFWYLCYTPRRRTLQKKGLQTYLRITHTTESRGQVVSTPTSCLRESGFKYRPGDRTS
jgi:hypothetical protein